jgi:pimeloyl-ACP methyl ester carboxylesterase
MSKIQGRLNKMTRIPLVLIPGLMCDGAVWEPLLPMLSPCASCQIIDHGQASSLTVMAQQVLDAAPAQFALAGHSMGGRVALEVLRLAPQRVTQLALLDTGYKARPSGPEGDEEARKRLALLEITRSQGVRVMANQWVQGMVKPSRLEDTTLIEAIVSMFERKSATIFENQIKALLARPDATPVLASTKVPTLVLCGREDSWSPISQHQEIAALVTGKVSMSVIADAGHMSTMEQPSAVAQAMREWLLSPEALPLADA